MKHALPILFAALSVCGLHAQIQITSAEMPVVGDELTNYADTLPAYGPGSSGPDQMWDFSAALQGYSTVSTFVDPSTTVDGDQFGNSNLALTTDGLNYSYMTNSIGSMIVDGFSGDPLGDGSITLVAPFEPTLTLHEFPRQFSGSFTDDFGFDVTVDGSQFGVYQARIRDVSTVHDTTDGYGTITTPLGTYDCLRSRLVTIRIDSIFAQLLQILPMTFVQATVDTTVSYSWHALETKLPVAEMTVDSLGQATSFTWSAIEPSSTAIHGAAPLNAGLSLFPQPAAEHVRISANTPLVSVAINDMNGRTVLRDERIATNDWVDLSALPAGVYVLSATSADGRRFSQRLVHINAL